jgi:hypothetical protein
VSRFHSAWQWFGNLETKLLADQIGSIAIERPVYIAGLARSGSTILLEAVAEHPRVSTHKYRDFPGVFTPYLWNGGQTFAGNCLSRQPQQRAHADGLMVTPESPEAMEEMLWMAFFPEAHNPRVSNVLGATDHNPHFEEFYREHIRKLLLVRGGERYASKANYNVSRLRYLLKLFPDARFVIPIRNPIDHVASLIKQHRLFSAAEALHPRALAHMRRVGHFEFGIDLRPINAGCLATVEDVQDLWRRQQWARGWARYWASIYDFLARQLAEDDALREATIVVRYERLCSDPELVLGEILDHCHLANEELVRDFAPRIQAPSYYQRDFSAQEVAAITYETAETAACFDYDLKEAVAGT